MPTVWNTLFRFADSAPVERLITHEKLAFMTEKSAMTMDYCNGDETSPSQRSYSVLRSKFDAWLMEQAEEAGAQLITGIASITSYSAMAKSSV